MIRKIKFINFHSSLHLRSSVPADRNAHLSYRLGRARHQRSLRSTGDGLQSGWLFRSVVILAGTHLVGRHLCSVCARLCVGQSLRETLARSLPAQQCSQRYRQSDKRWTERHRQCSLHAGSAGTKVTLSSAGHANGFRKTKWTSSQGSSIGFPSHVSCLHYESLSTLVSHHEFDFGNDFG